MTKHGCVAIKAAQLTAQHTSSRNLMLILDRLALLICGLIHSPNRGRHEDVQMAIIRSRHTATSIETNFYIHAFPTGSLHRAEYTVPIYLSNHQIYMVPSKQTDSPSFGQHSSFIVRYALLPLVSRKMRQTPPLPRNELA